MSVEHFDSPETNGEASCKFRVSYRKRWRSLGRRSLGRITMAIAAIVDGKAGLSNRDRSSARSWRPGDSIQLADNVDQGDLLGSIKDTSLRQRLLRRKMTAPEVTTISVVSPFDSATERLRIVKTESDTKEASRQVVRQYSRTRRES